MAADKILSLLGLSRRAGKLSLGYEDARLSVKEGKAALLLAAADLSEKSRKNLEFEARRGEVPLLELPWPMDALGRACGVKRAGALCVNDVGLAQAIQKEFAADRAADAGPDRKEEHSV